MNDEEKRQEKVAYETALERRRHARIQRTAPSVPRKGSHDFAPGVSAPALAPPQTPDTAVAVSGNVAQHRFSPRLRSGSQRAEMPNHEAELPRITRLLDPFPPSSRRVAPFVPLGPVEAPPLPFEMPCAPALLFQMLWTSLPLLRWSPYRALESSRQRSPSSASILAESGPDRLAGAPVRRVVRPLWCPPPR